MRAMPTARVNGVDLHYVERGSGRPVFFGHSLLMDHEMFEAQIGALSREHRCVAVDFRGHGQSPPSAGHYTLEDQAEDLHALQRHLGAERAVHVGHSMGGMTAMRLALAHPEAVAALALLDTSADAESAARRMQYEGMALMIDNVPPQALVEPITAIMFAPNFGREQPEVARRYREKLLALNFAAMAQATTAVTRRARIVEKLAEVRVPAIVIVGAQDVATPRDKAVQISEALGCRLVEIEGAAHMAPVERPEVVTAALAEFLRSLPP